MSGMEIERKFLVHKDIDFKRKAISQTKIQQGYILAKTVSVRIRIRDDKGYLTIKGPSTADGLCRYEFEKEITLQEANSLMAYCEPGVVDKIRYEVPVGDHIFEIDEFFGDNEGLVVAEVELDSPDEEYERPDFLGPEISADRRFRNSQLRKNPFKLWRDTLPEEYR